VAFSYPGPPRGTAADHFPTTPYTDYNATERLVQRVCGTSISITVTQIERGTRSQISLVTRIAARVREF
jgi:hypothetical protein